MRDENTSIGGLIGVYVALLVLLGLTAGANFLPLGAWQFPIALLIAVAKMLLIFWFFMQLRSRRGLVRVFACAGFFWLAIAGMLTFSDYLTRNWMF
jgi:cytochrome c oxidase subunit 4